MAKSTWPNITSYILLLYRKYFSFPLHSKVVRSIFEHSQGTGVSTGKQNNLMTIKIPRRTDVITSHMIYPRGVNFPASLISLLENFCILKCAKIQTLMCKLILATKDF